MAAFEPHVPGKSGRPAHRIIQVDLTPMVDLGFLLITFFIFTTVVSQPAVNRLLLPKDTGPATPVAAPDALTLRLLGNDSIRYYDGLEKGPGVAGTYSEVRQIVERKQRQVAALRGSPESLVLLIQPTAGCRYRDFMSVLDEVTINDIHHYYILADP